MSEHLTEQELAQYVDAIRGGRQELLPEKSLEHVADCSSCKAELIEMVDLIETLPIGVVKEQFQDR